MKRGPKLPEGFKGRTPEEKIAWLDRNWPLDPIDIAPEVQQTQQVDDGW
jgi:hypothetical protein